MKTKEPLPSDKTIKFSVHFWTNNIAESESIIFNSLMELPAKIEELLIREGITLHAKGNMGRYFKSE